MSGFWYGFGCGMIAYCVTEVSWELGRRLFGPSLRYLFVERWQKDDRCECGHTRDYHEKHWPACKGFREARQ